MAPSASPVKKANAETSQTSQKKGKEAPAGGGDIRNFFGSKPVAKPVATPRGASNKPITIDDSDDDNEVETKPVMSTATKPVASSSKSTKIAEAEKKPIVLGDSPPPQPTKPKPSAKKAVTKPKQEASDSEEDVKPVSSSKRKAQVISESESEEEVKPAKKKAASTPRKTPVKVATPKGKGKAKAGDDDFMDVDEDEDVASEEPEEEEEVELPKPKAAGKPPTKAKSLATKPKTKFIDDGSDEEPEKPKPKSNFAQFKNRSSEARAPGSKSIPEGSPDCLAGLSFVFTGELESLSREEAQDLAKRYGGRITGGPSGKTNYVVVGENAGEKKLETIKTTAAKQQADISKKKADKVALKKKERAGGKLTAAEKKKVAEEVDETIIQQITEDDFLNLIATRGSGELTDKQRKALEAAEDVVKKQALAMEKKEKEDLAEQKRKAKALAGTGVAVKVAPDPASQLWTTKYAPTSMKEICGNKGLVEKLGAWLEAWPKYYESGFKKGGKDGMGIFRAVLISGPPGIGKTTSAHLMAKQAGYSPIELNASDARSKKLVENATNIDNMSLDSFFSNGPSKASTVTGMNITSKTCLIMDEVDGMSAGDRGGVGALNVLIKKTKIPIVLICNDSTLQKMKPLHSTTFPMKFRRPQANEVRSRLMSILFKEKLKVPSSVLDELVKGTGSDIRQILNMLSTFKLLKKADMDFDEGKQLVQINAKHAAKNTFTLVGDLCAPAAFGKNNRDNLNAKLDLYFQDFSMIGLFIQEHYAKTDPSALSGLHSKKKDLKHLELLSKAADSISDGDLVDRMVHGGEQHWSLLPLHGVMSTVRPASLIYGMNSKEIGQGWGGPSFPSWLGQNSKQTKLSRMLGDIQIRMRLKVSGDKGEIRLNYMPTLASKLIKPIMNNGQEAIAETIECMDEYFLGKDDWDNMVELGVGHMREENIIKKIPTAVKTAFTRNFNKAAHPIAFHRADLAAGAAKKMGAGPAPDLEDVAEDDSAQEDDAVDQEPSNDDDVGKDKLIKAVKAKAVKAKAVKPKAKPKKEVL